MVLPGKSRRWEWSSRPDLGSGLRPNWTIISSKSCFGSAGFAGIYVDTIEEDDQAGTFLTLIGDNTFSENEFANPAL
jgi:hypothetical protein